MDFILNHAAEIILVLTAVFMVVKKYAKTWAAKTENTIDDKLAALLDKITVEDFTAWIKDQASKLETKREAKKGK